MGISEGSNLHLFTLSCICHLVGLTGSARASQND